METPLTDSGVAVAERYWKQHLGCLEGALFQGPVRRVVHGGEMDGYEGVFVLFRGDEAVISVPPGREEEIIELVPVVDCSPLTVALALVPMASAIIGPAFIGYAEAIQPVEARGELVRQLGEGDEGAIEVLREACEAKEWEHGGSVMGNPCSGVFEEGRLVALAGYEVWGGSIAHISVVTHPDFRGMGFGRSAVAHVAGRALEAGLLAQYRTLEGNRPSMTIAEALGFEKYASSLAVRFAKSYKA